MADPADLRRRIVGLLAATEGMSPGPDIPWEADVDVFDEDDGVVATISDATTSFLITHETEVRCDSGDGMWARARETQAFRRAIGLVALANSRGLIKEVADYLGDEPGMEEVERLVAEYGRAEARAVAVQHGDSEEAADDAYGRLLAAIRSMRAPMTVGAALAATPTGERRPSGRWRDTGANVWVLDLGEPASSPRLYVERGPAKGGAVWWWHTSGLPLYRAGDDYAEREAAKLAAENAARDLLLAGLRVLGGGG